ncbi:hypothetical protein SYNTR_2088 [Candidatus Syntrophocurvum alkaliphilum]|uniref:Ion transport domain-containing protein n=1 Tax=Candidatus Syntrophocurvum alkaliphilum TaxID=2293317 RepID=A0A6I6DDX1_9FIRM|nr:ion transporter [Candidatus Syntrophocurvum alkaliphilum]QGU00682.1 hypothetical protein SYNTR_2088 [Candidatus Syntrophocurvum alkaliphilum]
MQPVFNNANVEKKPYSAWSARIVQHPLFTKFIITLILINAVVIGLETYPDIFTAYKGYFIIAESIFLWVFTIEIILRLLATDKWYNFFKDGWNVFDFIIVASAHILVSGHFVSILRIIRVFRILRAISVIPSLQRLVTALIKTIPALGNILLLMGLIFYVFAVMGTILFAEVAPEYFGTLGTSLLALFQVVTLESWASAVMRPILVELPWAWIYFVAFILIGTFIVINLFIGVIVTNFQEIVVETKVNKEEDEEEDAQTELERLSNEIAELKAVIISLQEEKGVSQKNN